MNVEEVGVDGFDAVFGRQSRALCIQFYCIAFRIRAIGELSDRGSRAHTGIDDRGRFSWKVEETVKTCSLGWRQRVIAKFDARHIAHRASELSVVVICGLKPIFAGHYENSMLTEAERESR